MPKMPQKPQVGEKVLQSLYDSVVSIIDYLPAVTVRGDGNTTAVDNTPIGTIVHARPQAFNMHNGNGSEYYAGSGIIITSGNIINSKISAGPNINIDYNSGWLVISGTPAASGGGGPDTNDTYIGDANYYSNLSGNHIFITPNADYNGSHLVSSTLNWLQELNNNKFCESGRVTFPTTSHVITNDIGVNSDHCITPTDLIHDGLGTTVNYSWMRSPFGDEPTAMIGLVNGLQVDLTLSGGKYADVVLYQNKGGFGPVSHEVEPPTQSTINILLSGDGQIDPTTGHIFIRDIANDNGTSGGIIYTNLHAGNNVTIDPDGAINATGGGGGPDTNTEYIGDKNVDLSGHIWVNQTGSSPRLISSDLVHIDDLLNYPLSGDGNHFIQVNNLKDGAGTSIDFHWNSTGDHTEEGGGPDTLIKFVDGICVNLNISGGTYVTTKFHQGVGYGDYSSASIDCNLSGDRDINNSGLITIVPQYDIEQNITGGIISSVLHAGSGITIDSTGEISTTGGGGGGGGDFDWPNYDNLGEESDTRVYPLMRYTTSTGGWLRISCKGGTSRCVGVWIDDNYYGLGQGIMTWPLAIPPGCSFYVDVDWSLNNLIWFDSTVTPGTVTNQQYDYWFIPPQWDPNRNTISDARNTFSSAKYEETCCYNCMTGAAGDLRAISSDWTKLTMISGSDPYAEPYSRQYYEDRITSMQKHLSGDGGDPGENNDCQYHWDEAITYCQQLRTQNTSLPSANPMYTYQVTDIPARCQQYYGKIEQYITSGQSYYDLVDAWWTQHDQNNE